MGLLLAVASQADSSGPMRVSGALAGVSIGGNYVAVGPGATATNGGTALGISATGTHAGLALGNYSGADSFGVAVGMSSVASNNAVAIGMNAAADGEGNVAIGGNYSSEFTPNASIPSGFTDTVELGRGTATVDGALHYRGNPVVSSNGTILASVPSSVIVGENILKYQPETESYLARVAAQGGSVSATTVLALDDFASVGRREGWLSSIKYFWCPVGDFVASKVPFIGTNIVTYNNLTDVTNYLESYGLFVDYQDSTSGGKWADTTFIPSSNGLVATNFSIISGLGSRQYSANTYSGLWGACPTNSGNTDNPFFRKQEGLIGFLNNLRNTPKDSHKMEVDYVEYGANQFALVNGVLGMYYTNAYTGTNRLTLPVSILKNVHDGNGVAYYANGCISFLGFGTSVGTNQAKRLADAAFALNYKIRSATSKIYVIGDSIAAGDGPTFGRILAGKYGNTIVNVSQGSRALNSSSSGYPSGMSVYQQINDSSASGLIVELGTNDKRADTLKSTTGTAATITSLKNSLVTIVNNFLAQGLRVVLIGPAYGTTNDSGSAVCQMAYAEAAASAAIATKVPYLDYLNLFADTTATPWSSTVLPIMGDNVHPNTSGQALLGDALIRVWRGQLYRRPALTFGTVGANSTATNMVTLYGSLPGMPSTCGTTNLETGLVVTGCSIIATNTALITVYNYTASPVVTGTNYWSIQVETGW